jgi:hypothetical protein
MLKSLLGAALAAAVFYFSAAGHAAAQAPSAPSLAEIREAITASEDITIDSEHVISGETILILSYRGLHLAMVVSCPPQNAPQCTGVAFFTPYPQSMKASLDFLNKANGSAKLGWLSMNQQGRVAAQHGLVTVGVSREALLLNIRVYAAIYAIRGKQILDGGLGTLIGAPASAEGRIIDANHLPEPIIGASAGLDSLFDEPKFGDGLTEVLGDAQRYGQLRKIANDFFGE